MLREELEEPAKENVVMAKRGAGSASAMFEASSLLLRIAEMLAVALAAWVIGEFMLDNLTADRRENYINAVLLGTLFYAGLAEVTGVYDVDVRFSVRTAWGRVLSAWFATSMFLVTMAFLTKVSATYSRAWAILWFVAGAVALCAVRAGITYWLRRLKRQGVFNQRVAIFGAATQGNRLAKYIESNDKLTIDLVGFYDDRPLNRLPDEERRMELRGDLDKLVEEIRAGHVDQVIIALPWSADTRLEEIVAKLAVTPIRIRLAPDLASFTFTQRPMVMLGDLPVMTLFERPISGLDQWLKKLEDLVIGALATLLLLPLFALIAVAIKLDSPGPIFFRQPREGFNNRTFRIWKFRSMRHDTAQVDGITQATRGDNRITRVGAILRRTSLDELPQLFNVITGEMSLVGPRPHAASTKAGGRHFGEVVATYAARHKVKPGMTGWAQVCGWRGETETEEKLIKRLEHDLHYIENWSVWFDLYILVRTVPALLSNKAY